jgi:pyrimidine operon attenuation protein / uracil phosphoribosyltransferase
MTHLTAGAVLDAEPYYQTLLEQIRSSMGPEQPFLVGVQTKGAKIARRLHQDLQIGTPLGLISSSMHRDDYALRGLGKADQTDLPFEVEQADIVLVDDVLFTGRTVRAILNELFDFGRPKRIRLAVLIDRGGRQLPIQADFCAAHLQLDLHTALSLRQGLGGQFELAVTSQEPRTS